MDHYAAKIVYLSQIAHDYYKLGFVWKTSNDPKPGQFITLRIGESSVPLLRRPFALSLFDDEEKISELIFLKRGTGTRVLAGAKPGESLDVIGPLGNPFPQPDKRSFPVLVAGGVGIGPILFLAQVLRARNIDFLLLAGSRNAEFLPVKTIEERVTSALLFTDDGTDGIRGTPLDYLSTVLEDHPNAEVFACGPDGMLRGCVKICEDHGKPCWVSVEQVMACGVGACMGCAVRLSDGVSYARACTEGPVFNARDLWWGTGV